MKVIRAADLPEEVKKQLPPEAFNKYIVVHDDKSVTIHDEPSVPKVIGVSAVQEALPALGMAGGYGVGANLGLRAGGIAARAHPLLGLAAGLGTAALVRYLQNKGIKAVSPETFRKLEGVTAVGEETHPLASLAGSLVGSTSAFRPVVNLETLGKAISKRSWEPIVKGLPTKGELAKVAGMGAGLEAGREIVSGEELSPGAMLTSGLSMMALSGGPTRLGRLVTPKPYIPPTPAEAQNVNKLPPLTERAAAAAEEVRKNPDVPIANILEKHQLTPKYGVEQSPDAIITFGNAVLKSKPLSDEAIEKAVELFKKGGSPEHFGFPEESMASKVEKLIDNNPGVVTETHIRSLLKTAHNRDAFNNTLRAIQQEIAPVTGEVELFKKKVGILGQLEVPKRVELAKQIQEAKDSPDARKQLDRILKNLGLKVEIPQATSPAIDNLLEILKGPQKSSKTKAEALAEAPKPAEKVPEPTEKAPEAPKPKVLESTVFEDWPDNRDEFQKFLEKKGIPFKLPRHLADIGSEDRAALEPFYKKFLSELKYGGDEITEAGGFKVNVAPKSKLIATYMDEPEGVLYQGRKYIVTGENAEVPNEVIIFKQGEGYKSVHVAELTSASTAKLAEQAKAKSVETPKVEVKPTEVPAKPTEVPKPAKPKAKPKTKIIAQTEAKPTEVPTTAEIKAPTKPIEEVPAKAEVKPAETKPAEAPTIAEVPKPVEAKPLEAPTTAKVKPTETKPVKTKPVETPTTAEAKPTEVPPKPTEAPAPAEASKPVEAPTTAEVKPAKKQTKAPKSEKKSTKIKLVEPVVEAPKPVETPPEPKPVTTVEAPPKPTVAEVSAEPPKPKVEAPTTAEVKPPAKAKVQREDLKGKRYVDAEGQLWEVKEVNKNTATLTNVNDPKVIRLVKIPKLEESYLTEGASLPEKAPLKNKVFTDSQGELWKVVGVTKNGQYWFHPLKDPNRIKSAPRKDFQENYKEASGLHPDDPYLGYTVQDVEKVSWKIIKRDGNNLTLRNEAGDVITKDVNDVDLSTLQIKSAPKEAGTKEPDIVGRVLKGPYEHEWVIVAQEGENFRLKNKLTDEEVSVPKSSVNLPNNTTSVVSPGIGSRIFKQYVGKLDPVPEDIKQPRVLGGVKLTPVGIDANVIVVQPSNSAGVRTIKIDVWRKLPVAEGKPPELTAPKNVKPRVEDGVVWEPVRENETGIIAKNTATGETKQFLKETWWNLPFAEKGGEPISAIPFPQGRTQEVKISKDGKIWVSLGLDPKDPASVVIRNSETGEVKSISLSEFDGWQKPPEGEKLYSGLPLNLASEGFKVIGKGINTILRPILRGTGERLMRKYPGEGRYVMFEVLPEFRRTMNKLFNSFHKPIVRAKQVKEIREDVVLEYLYDMQDYGASLVKLTPKEQQVVDLIRESFLRSYDAQLVDGPLVSGKRPKELGPDYFPTEFLDSKVRKILTGETPNPELRAKYFQEFAEWYADKTGGSIEEGKKVLEDYLGMHGRVMYKEAPTFGAVRDPAGYGFPRDMRSKKLWEILDRFNLRTAADLSWYRTVQKDPTAAYIFGEESNGRGGSINPEDAILPGGTKAQTLGGEPYIKLIKGEMTLAKRISVDDTEAISGLVNAFRFGLRTTARDILGTFSPMASWMKPSEFNQLTEGLRNAIKSPTLYKAGAVRLGRGMDWFTQDFSETGLIKLADIIRTINGRNAGEKAIRSFVNETGRLLAENRLNRYDSASPSERKELDRFFEYFVGPKWRTLSKEELLDRAGVRFMEWCQGSYSPEYLPPALLRSNQGSWLRSYFSLARWSIERFRRWRIEAIDPLEEKGDIKPLLKSLGIAALISAPILGAIEQYIFNQKPQELTWKEWWNLKEDTLYTLFYKAALTGYAGILGQLGMSGLQAMRGQKPMFYENPMWSWQVNTMKELFLATAAGLENPSDWLNIIAQLPVEILANEMQNFRILRNWGKERPEREVRLWEPKRPWQGEYFKNPYRATTKWREAETPEELKTLVPRVSQQLKGGAFELPPRQNTAIQPLEFYVWLGKAQGKEAMRKRLKDDFEKEMFTELKNTMSEALHAINAPPKVELRLNK